MAKIYQKNDGAKIHDHEPFRIRFLLFLLMVSGFSCFSQVNRNYASILDRDVFLTNLQSESGQRSSSHLKSLLDNLQPSVYFESGVTKVYGEQPNALFTDPNSLTNFSNATIDVQHIEIVTIRLSKVADVNQIIDLSVFSNYPKLRYVYIISTVANTPERIIRNVRNNSNQFRVFYKIDLGS